MWNSSLVFLRLFFFFFNFEWNRITRVGWSWLFPFPRSVRHIIQFPVSAGLVKNRVQPLLEDRGVFSKIFFVCV